MDYIKAVKLFLIIWSPLLANSANLNVRFQKDLFIQRNKCGEKRKSLNSAIFLSFDEKKEILRKKILFYLAESNIGFEQVAIFNQKNFFYPGQFGPEGHREYELPYCPNKSPTCQVGFFVFDRKNKLQGKNVNFDLKLFDIDSDHKLLNSLSSNIAATVPDSSNNESYLFEDTQLELIDKTYYAWANKDKVRSLLKDNYEVELFFHWRKNVIQQQYSEQKVDLMKWLESKDEKIKFINQPQLTYLSFLVFVKKNERSYETKIEILNQKEIFYSCNQ